jgi:hypothetical protein
LWVERMIYCPWFFQYNINTSLFGSFSQLDLSLNRPLYLIILVLYHELQIHFLSSAYYQRLFKRIQNDD